MKPKKDKPKKSTVERCRKKWQQCITIRHSVTGEVIELRPCLYRCPLLNESI